MLKADLLRCSVAELKDCLLCFIREVKQSDGEPYSPGRLFYLCLSIQLFLFQNGRLENIFSDLIYDRFSTELTRILKPSVTCGGCVLSCVEEQFLWDCKQLGAYSPTVLLNTLLFFFCKYFGFTTVEQHRRLSFANITFCTKTSKSNTKTTFLRFHPPTCTNHEESDTYDVPAKKVKKNESEEDFLEMMENQENPLRCPVRLYEFYLSKCPASLRQRSDLFYLQPDRSCLPSSPLWFSPAPLNDSSVEATIIRILAVRGLQGGRDRVHV
ncbi:zinc finger MYM-type protein 4-like [Pelmatolapia mariae]|uniref:zinc finger MYM-type protein 4-like n=1 Tax=Pelmatolapia mariae TaxID=158779 RepID=UPI003211DD7D